MENVLVLPSTPLATRGSRALVWTGRVLTGLVLAFLLVDAIAKLIPLAPVIEATQKLVLWIAYYLRSARLRAFLLSSLSPAR